MNTREQLAGVMRNIQTLPTLPDVALKLLEMGESPLSSTRDMASVVERDVTLAARVLKLVNAPFFGMQREVTSVRQALLFLGISHLRSLVLSSVVLDLFDREGSVGDFDRREFWKHSLAVGAAARALAVRTRCVDAEIAFTAGLIHDIGKVVEDRYLHGEFVKVVELLKDPTRTMIDAEREVLDADHAQIGHHLTVHWNLPAVLRDAVGLHHNPEAAESSSAMAALIAVADHLVRRLGVGKGGGADAPLQTENLARCGLDSETMESVIQDMVDVLEDQVGTLIASD